MWDEIVKGQRSVELVEDLHAITDHGRADFRFSINALPEEEV